MVALLHGARVGILYFKVQELCGNSHNDFPYYSVLFYVLTREVIQLTASNLFPHEYEKKNEQQNPDREWAE